MLIGKIGPQFQYMTDVEMAESSVQYTPGHPFWRSDNLIVLRQSYETSAAVSNLYERIGLGIPVAVT